jgi:lysyl-tRNA synthetase class 2
MDPEEKMINDRKSKLKELRNWGVEPYPYIFNQKNHAQDITDKYSKIKTGEETKVKVSMAGRVMLVRIMGKASFFDIQDESGRIQCYIRKDDVKEAYKVFKKVDIGDFVGIEGTVFKTKKGELSIFVRKFTLLTKTLRPLPEKWHGLKDVELRYRKRYLDLIANPELKEVFIKRQRIIDTMRAQFNKKGFLEVETPILQPIYGGANARPFKTFLHDLKMDVYMRVSNELYLKRLIVGGFEKVFEFSKDFRNESIDRSHNPEFLQVEAYQAYADYNDTMRLVEDVVEASCKAVNGSTKAEYEGHKVDFKKPWKRITMKDAIKAHANIDVDKFDLDGLKKLLKKNHIEFEKDISHGSAILLLFEELVEDKLIQPHFVMQYPKESTPLCKRDRDNPEFNEQFECYICGMEVANSYSELNDPIIQRKNLEEQAKQLRQGDNEAHPMDEDFIQAIETGMPPTGGVGIGIDRVCMIILGQKSIRDVILFPFMKV